jgi:hypothetical protein
MNSALPPYRPYPYGLKAELKSGQEFCGRACNRSKYSQVYTTKVQYGVRGYKCGFNTQEFKTNIVK